MNTIPFFLALIVAVIVIGSYKIWLEVYRRPVDPCMISGLTTGSDDCLIATNCVNCKPAAIFQRRQAAYLGRQKRRVGLDGPCAECRHKEHDAMACRSCGELWRFTDPERQRALSESCS